MLGRLIYIIVFCLCFILLIRGLPYRFSPLIGIPILGLALFLLYTNERSTLTSTMLRYLRFSVLYSVWTAIFLRIHLRYAIFLAVAYQVFMGIWISCTQVAFYYLGISGAEPLTICTGILRVGSILIIRQYFLKPVPSRNPTLREMAISLFPAVACFISNLVLFDGLSNPSVQTAYLGILPFLVIFFGFSALLVLVNSENYFEATLMKTEMEKARLQMQSQYQLLLQEQENSRRLHALHHDMRGHLETIHALAGTEASVQNYIRQLEDSVQSLEPVFFTGDPTLDALLTRKKTECDKLGIRMECYIHLSQNDYLPSMELCSLFFNCIDNAIEAISRSEGTSRYIHLTGGEINGSMVIRIENAYSDTLLPDGSLFATTKKDQTHHGFGLTNMKEIIERHNGTLTLQTEDNKFIVTWRIPHP